MALVRIRIGSMVDMHQYESADFDSAFETDQPIKAGAPVDVNDVLRLTDVSGGLPGSYKYYAASILDDGTYALPTVTANYPAHGFVQLSNGAVIVESAEFEYGSDGNVQIIRGSANVVVNVDTDGKVCLGTAAGQNPLTVKNRLGGTRQIIITLWYK
jgi:hypothetical protein